MSSLVDSGFGSLTPRVHSALKPSSQAYLRTLARYECQAMTTRRAAYNAAEQSNAAPLVWQRSKGINVEDADGNIFVDMVAGFGVAALGHNPDVIVQAVEQQCRKLMHALGDLHPSVPKIELLEALGTLAPWPDSRAILGLHGSDAIEAAFKTAALYSGKPGIVAFQGAYHGLHYGPLATCGYSPRFRDPFAKQLNSHIAWCPYPGCPDDLEHTRNELETIFGHAKHTIGAIIVEPILGRGGIILPPPEFLPMLRRFCDAHQVLLIVDEILTGLGRCGQWWQSTGSVSADILCIGKALGGGMPISACLAPSSIMQAWGEPGQEVIHTATFLGNPLGCAAALANLNELQSNATQLFGDVRDKGNQLHKRLQRLRSTHSSIRDVRGTGLMWGIEFDNASRVRSVVQKLLQCGYITLLAGKEGRVLQLSPPLVISEGALDAFYNTLEDVLVS